MLVIFFSRILERWLKRHEQKKKNLLDECRKMPKTILVQTEKILWLWSHSTVMFVFLNY